MNKKIKKLTAFFSSAAIAVAGIGATAGETSVLAENTAVQEQYYVKGDLLIQYSVSNMEALEIQKYLAQIVELDDVAVTSCDADGDGNVSINDAVNVMTWVTRQNTLMYVGDYARRDGTPDEVYEVGESRDVKINTDMAGLYKLRIKYAGKNTSYMYVSANNSNKGVYKEFKSTGSDNGWSEAVVVLKLNEGENIINFVNSPSEESPVIESFTACRYCGLADLLTDMPEKLPAETTTTTTTALATTVVTTTTAAPVTTAATTTTAAPVTTAATTTTAAPVTTTTVVTEPSKVRYYAADAEIYKGITETVNGGFEGSSYVNYDNVKGSAITWTVNVPEDGNYQVDFRFANGTDSIRTTKVTVNGERMECCYIDFTGTGAWTEWKTNSVVLALKAGNNTIKATATTEFGGPNIDFIEVEKTDAPAEELVKSTDGRQMEDLNRGVSAANAGNGVLVSWRILASDNENTTFKLYKNGKTPPIYEGTINDATCYFDSAGTATDWYTIDTFVNGEMTEFAQASINLTNKNSGQSGAYFDISLNKPAELTMPDGTTCTYTPNDCSVGDVDNDGEYEIIVKWDPSNSQDNSKNGYTGNVYLDCYKMNGTQLWRIDLGKNIRAGAHYTQFIVYDLDGDGKSELMCKTADGTKDGKGNYIGDASKDYRSSAGRILTGPEYLTLFDGETGAALDTIDYEPARGTVKDWGDDYGNRVDRFLAGVAYLDGKTPSAVFARGYYTRACIASYDVKNKKIVKHWTYDTGFNSGDGAYAQGNHSLCVMDVDSDGKDEIIYGSCCIDDGGKLLWSTKLGHGDCMQAGDLIPERPGLEVFQVHEEVWCAEVHDAATGEIIWRVEGGDDVGRGIALNMTKDTPGMEFASVADGKVYYYNPDTDKIEEAGYGWNDKIKWGMNSAVWWNGDLEREALDRTMVESPNGGRQFTGDGASYNNASKSNACITADIFGDWREEMIFPANDGNSLRVFATTIATDTPLFTLMHDSQYRTGVAIENVGYNQAPNTSFFLGTGYPLPEVPEVDIIK